MTLRLPIRVSSFRAFVRLFVTLLTGIIVAGCSITNLTPRETCNSRAYIRTPLEVFVKQRFPYGAAVRVGIIPFAVPANFAGQNPLVQDTGRQIAQNIHRELLSQDSPVTIVEILNRSEWPGQAQEFYEGNHRALALGRAAGYDLLFVGVLERPDSHDSLSAFAKLIEVESGITVWSGRGRVQTNRNERLFALPSSLWQKTPMKYPRTNVLIEELAECLIQDALSEEYAPE